ncbi:efflux RND transporter permease subunit, partial [Pseudomonas aeruginosa]|uniref:efflux RND transporter permease subunit n=1 Tax=Pseudomonas aeruginosa TaxID=287 RepID=UPI0031B70353
SRYAPVLEEWQHQHPDATLDNKTRWQVITDASVEVGPALFISLLIITLSFIPIFTLEGQEGRLFGPLAFTKTYAMAAAAQRDQKTMSKIAIWMMVPM